MYYMTPTCPPSWTSKGLLAVLRDTLPEHDLASATAPEAVPATLRAPLLDDVEARQARIERMGRRLKQLAQVADASAATAVTA
ncbi:MAG: hypothetical protein WA159_09255 [Variovorax sp.]